MDLLDVPFFAFGVEGGDERSSSETNGLGSVLPSSAFIFFFGLSSFTEDCRFLVFLDGFWGVSSSCLMTGFSSSCFVDEAFEAAVLDDLVALAIFEGQRE